MDISSLRERGFCEPISVSELNGYIKRLFEGDRALSAISIRGEISNLVYHRSGHLYFSLKDEEGQIRAVMFRSSAQRLKFTLENGMKVVARGSVTVYTRDGSYQLYVNNIEPDGVGALYMAYEQLKAKLEGEGLFDEYHKKLIPQFATRIGIITSPTGAAVRDIINVSKRRFSAVKLYLYPALVQGEGSAESLIKALDYLDKSGLVDVIIIGRGGGSIEDLWAFNNEALARRIFSAKIPIISAVGHETDFTICDFVADLRAPTPSAAAELAVPDAKSFLRYVDNLYDRAAGALLARVKNSRESLRSLSERGVITNPTLIYKRHRQSLEALSKNLNSAILSSLNEKKQRFAINSEKTNAYSPLLTLSRGYSIAEINGENLRSVNNAKVGDEFSLILSDGRLACKVEDVRRKDEKEY